MTHYLLRGVFVCLQTTIDPQGVFVLLKLCQITLYVRRTYRGLLNWGEQYVLLPFTPTFVISLPGSYCIELFNYSLSDKLLQIII